MLAPVKRRDTVVSDGIPAGVVEITKGVLVEEIAEEAKSKVNRGSVVELRKSVTGAQVEIKSG